MTTKKSRVSATADTRRRFLASFAALGLASTLLPGVLWAQIAEKKEKDGKDGKEGKDGSGKITIEMLKTAAVIAGLSLSDDDYEQVLTAVNQNLARYVALRKISIPNNVAPPLYFNPLVPGMTVNRKQWPFMMSAAPKVTRPANLEEVAFWPITQLAQLLKTRAVTSVELTQMYLGRLHRLNAKLNCVVTFLDDVAMAQAKKADAEIAAGNYKGPLHGIPWGAKDIIAVKGYKTTWGSGAFQDQMIDEDASVVELLREAGAVLIAKVTTGELAGGDVWFGGRTNNPWKLDQGSSGSSAGPCSATAGGCIAFGIGSETSGSILGPSARCGITGLRPTFGRSSRYGVMVLSWAQDRLGPLCRAVEDTAIVMQAIAKPDGRDMSVMDIPFNWNAGLDVKKLRIGYLKDAFEETKGRPAESLKNEQATLAKLKELGHELIPITTPDDRFGDTLAVGETRVEASAFFDELIRSGRNKFLTTKTRTVQFGAARFIPGTEFLQSQRVRMMTMQALAEATAGVDVYLAPGGGGGGPREGAGAAGPGSAAGAAAGGGEAAGGGGRGGGGRGSPDQPRTAAARHSQFANLACYPAMALPNGFAADGTPTSVTFFARPFGEAELLAVAKQYQDATDFHLKHPSLG